MRDRPTKEQFIAKLEWMTTTLKDEIRDRVYQPGEYLPSEKALAKQYELSNNSVRKALEELVREGWIEKVPNVGNRVLSREATVKLTLGCNESSVRNLDLYSLVHNFEQKYPWCAVDVLFYPFKTSMEENPVDVFTLSPMQFQDLIERQKADMFTNQVAKAELYPFLYDYYHTEGSMYVHPLAFSPVILCYNPSHFQKAGLSIPHGGWTWADLRRHATLLAKANGTPGFSFHVPDINRWPIFLLQSGESFLWDQGHIRDIRGSRILEAIRLSKEIIQDRNVYSFYFSESNQEIEEMFLAGKVSMILSSYMALNEWKNIDFDYDISPVPFIHEPRTIVVATGVAVRKGSQYPEAAQLLADYLCSADAQLHIRTNTLSIPSHQGQEVRLNRDDVQMSNVPERYTLYHEMVFSYLVHEKLNISTCLLKPLYDLIKAYWADLIDEEELCERISQDLVDK